MVAASCVAAAVSFARAQPGSDYDFDFVTIGAPGNAPYTGDSPYNPPIAVGRGTVNYEYRIGRTEVTTSQWLGFVNTFTMREDSAFGLDLLPAHWGAEPDSAYSGPGYRWTVPTSGPAAMLPVSGITWREAALFCNWLNNGKPTERASIATGAYDTSTWGGTPPTFTDGPTHLPGAQFWIPSLDEWIKAAHFDPHRYGEGSGGWWVYPNGSDDPLVSGLPGTPGSQTSAGVVTEEPWGEWSIPLGAYPDVQSPWGLLDVSGGEREWTEEVVWPDSPQARVLAGSWAGFLDFGVFDHVSAFGGTSPSSHAGGIRIASSVPAPHAGMMAIVGIMVLTRRTRR